MFTDSTGLVAGLVGGLPLIPAVARTTRFRAWRWSVRWACSRRAALPAVVHRSNWNLAFGVLPPYSSRQGVFWVASDHGTPGGRISSGQLAYNLAIVVVWRFRAKVAWALSA